MGLNSHTQIKIFLVAVLTGILSVKAEEVIRFDEPLFNSSIKSSLQAIKTNQVDIQKLFSEKHLDTEYYPVKLEISFNELVEIDLESILGQAIKNNIDLNIAKQNSKMAKWKFWNRIADALPDVSLLARSQHRDGTFYLNSRFRSQIDETIVTTDAKINYRLFDGGTTTFLALAERFYKTAVEDAEKASYNQTLLNSVNYYYDLLKAQVALSSRLKALERAKADLELSKQFLVAGTGTKYDVLQAEARMARTQQALVEEESLFRNAEMNLAQHLNLPLLTPFKIKETEVKELNLIDESITIDQFIHTAMTNNPEILAAVAAKRGALREGLSKVGDFLPKVDIYADFTGSGQNFGDTVNITTLGFDATYSIGSGLGLTAFSNAMESKAKVKAAELEYKKEMQRIEKNLRMAFIDYQKSKALVEAAYKELLASQESVRLAKLRYETGVDIFTNFISKESELTQAELNLISSTAEYNLAQANLVYQMGAISVENLLNKS